MKLVEVVESPVPEVVDLLQDALVHARAGRVKSLIVLYEDHEGFPSFGVAWEKANLSQLAGQLERIKFLLVTKMIAEELDAQEEPSPDPMAS